MNAAPVSRLLLVDDHENIRFTFGLALKSDGYDVDTAASVGEARALIARGGYDGLILDLRLGAESGLQLLTDLRGAGIETPTLMITAHGTFAEAVSAMKLGAVDFVEKPLQPITFRATVAQMLNRRPPAAAGRLEILDPETCGAQIVEARHAINCRDYTAARLHLAAALEIDGESADAHYLFGLMLERTNEASKAERFFRRALQLYSDRSLAKSSARPRG